MSANNEQPARTPGPERCASFRRGRRFRRAAGGAAVAILSVAGPVALSGPAQAATAVTPGAVTVSPTTAGSPSDYSVPFTVSGSGALAPGGTITVTAPDGTVWPASAGSYGIVVNHSHAATVQSVSVSDVTGPGSNSTSATANQVVITLATSTIADGDLVTASTSGMSATNPTLASTTYVMNESTSADTTPAASPHYSITAGPVMGLVVTGGDNQSSSGVFSVPLSATAVDTYGNPVTTAVGTVTFSAPSSGASVTFAPCSSNPHTYQCVTSLSGGVATSSTPTATGGAGGPYAVTASLTSPPESTSPPFELTNLAAPPSGSSVTPQALTLSSHTEGASPVTYTFPFTSTSALGSGSSITFLAPNGTVFPGPMTSYTVANTTLGGASQTISSVNPAKAAGPGAPTTDPACTNEQGSLSGSTCTSNTNNEVVINLGAPTLVNAGNTVTVTVTGMTNPTFATSGDVVDESTSADTLPAATSAYAINPGPLASIVVTSGSNQSAEVSHAFGQNLVATALDGAGNPVSGVAVTFTAPGSGASATFPNTTTTQISTTGANGQATAQAPTANSTAGAYHVTATSGAVAASPSFALTNTTPPGTPGTLILGSNTEGATGVTYTVPFTTTANGAIPASGTITLVAPNGTALPGTMGNYSVAVNNGHAATVSGVSATAVVGPGANTVSGTTNQALITLGSSNIANGDTLTVTITNVTNPSVASTTDVMDEATSADQTLAASPTYTINPGAASQLVVTGGNSQATGVNEPFATPMSVTLEDAAGNTVPGAGFAVMFAAPSSGPSGTFDPAGCSGNTGATPAYECITSTSAGGVATASTFTANSTAGGYNVTASADPVTNGTFSLTNVPVLTPGGITVMPDTAASSATYTVPFTTSADGAIPASGACTAACTITLVAPNNTALPSSAGAYTVTVNHNHAATVSSVAVSKVAGPGSNGVSATNNQVVITLLASSVAAGDLVTVTITGVTSPSAAGNYQMKESTASDTIAQTSPPYAVTAGAASKVVAASGNNQVAQVGTAYAAPLTATVEDAHSNPEGAGIAVTFTAPASGAGGTFAAGCASNPSANVCVADTNASGVATASTLTADATPGQFTVVASSAGLTSANFTLTNETAVTPGDVTLSSPTVGATPVRYTVPFTTSASAGSIPPSGGACPANCTITIVAPNDTTFSSSTSDYGVTANNGHGATVGGVAVSAVMGPGSNSVSATNNQAVITLSASTIAGGDQVTVQLSNATNPTTASDSYQLDESTSGDPVVATSPDYSVTADAATTMNYVSGNNQSTQVGTDFPGPLVVQFFDEFGNPVPNWNVVFATPGGSPTATFAPCAGGNPNGNNNCEVASDADGVATSSVLTADGTTGSYQGGAFTSGTVSPVLFTLTNTAAPVPPPPPPPPAPPASQGDGGPVVLQQNGAPSLFVVGSGGSLLNYWYIPQTGQWGSATVASSGVTAPPSVQLQQNGAPTVFVQGAGGSLWNYWYIPQTGQWGAAEIASGGVASQPYAQLQPANGAPTVFVEGAGGSLFNYWYIPETGQWGAAEIVSGGVASAPGVQLQQNGAPTVFVEGAGGSLLNYWYIPQTGQWGAGTVASGGVASRPAVQVQPANGEPTVFVTGAGGSLLNYWYIPQSGSWGAAQIVSSGVTSAPSIQLQPANGAPTVFVQGGGGSLFNFWYIPQSGGWGAAEIASGGVASQPAVQLQPANGAPTLFVVTSGGAVLNYWYIPQSGSWGAATVAGGGVVAP